MLEEREMKMTPRLAASKKLLSGDCSPIDPHRHIFHRARQFSRLHPPFYLPLLTLYIPQQGYKSVACLILAQLPVLQPILPRIGNIGSPPHVFLKSVT